MKVDLDGREVFIHTANKPVAPDRPTVVWIHGAAHDHSVWSWQSRWFAHHGWNSLALDLPGHGRSGGAPLAAIGDIADLMPKLLDALNLPKASFAGHSMGALAALETAARTPERTQRLVLVGCAFPMAVADPLLDAALNDTPKAIRMITTWSHAPATHLSGGPTPGQWLPGINTALMARARPGVLYRDLQNCRDYVDGMESAKKVQAPTLMIVGDRDLMTPRKTTDGLAGALTDGRRITVSAGHAMMSEAPDATLDAIRVFLQ